MPAKCRCRFLAEGVTAVVFETSLNEEQVMDALKLSLLFSCSHGNKEEIVADSTQEGNSAVLGVVNEKLSGPGRSYCSSV